MSWASCFWSPVSLPMKSLVPLLAIVPRWSMASCSLMPIPLSWMVSVLASLSKCTRTSRLGASSYSALLFSASKRSLSQASDALEISSRRKISLLEYSECVNKCSNWATSAWKERVCLVMVEKLRVFDGKIRASTQNCVSGGRKSILGLRGFFQPRTWQSKDAIHDQQWQKMVRRVYRHFLADFGGLRQRGAGGGFPRGGHWFAGGVPGVLLDGL